MDITAFICGASTILFIEFTALLLLAILSKGDKDK